MWFETLKNKNGKIIGFSLEAGIARHHEEEKDFVRNFPNNVSTGKGIIEIKENTLVVESPYGWHSFTVKDEEAKAIKKHLKNKKLMFTGYGGLPLIARITFLDKIPKEAFGLETESLYSFEEEEDNGTRLFRKGSSPKKRCKIEHLALGEKMILRLYDGKKSKKITSSIVKMLTSY